MVAPVALVPLRSPGRGKTRLSRTLTAAARAALAEAMFRDVITALRAASVERILVAASGPGAAGAASALGLEVHLDPPQVSSLDAVLAATTGALHGSLDVLVVAADLPRITGGEITELLGTDAEVVLAPTRGGGTGGLLRRPGGRIPTAYGAGSARRHRELARAAGATFASLHAPGFHDDVDTATDLAELRHGHVGPATSRLLRDPGEAGAALG